MIFISHKLHEVLAVADRITILRAGRAIATVDRGELTPRSLAALMVGREVETAQRARDGGRPGLSYWRWTVYGSKETAGSRP